MADEKKTGAKTAEPEKAVSILHERDKEEFEKRYADGVDPKPTGVRIVSEKTYIKVANVRDAKENVVFFDPRNESTSYRPALDLTGLTPTVRERVNAILAEEV